MKNIIFRYLYRFFFWQIEAEGKPITNQKSTGRCWIFACLNVIRVPFIKKYELEDFEFSQAYIFFWDKVRVSWNRSDFTLLWNTVWYSRVVFFSHSSG